MEQILSRFRGVPDYSVHKSRSEKYCKNPKWLVTVFINLFIHSVFLVQPRKAMRQSEENKVVYFCSLFFSCGASHAVRIEALKFIGLKLGGVKSSRQTGAVQMIEVMQPFWRAVFPSNPILRWCFKMQCPCYLFRLHVLPKPITPGMWLLPWHLMLACHGHCLQRPSQYSCELSPYLSTLFSPSQPPSPPAFLLFVMLSLSLRGHTVTLFTGSQAGVRGVCAWMRACVCMHMCTFARSIWLLYLTNLNMRWHAHTTLAHVHRHRID